MDEVLFVAIEEEGRHGWHLQRNLDPVSAVKPVDKEQPTAVQASRLQQKGAMAKDPPAKVSSKPTALKHSFSLHARPADPSGWDELVKCLPSITKTELFDEEFWDTDDNTLKKLGWWCSRRDGEEKLTQVKELETGVLKIVDGDLHLVQDAECSLIKARITDSETLKSKLKDLLGDQTTKAYATFTTRRYTFGDGDYIIDAVGGLPNGKIDIVLRLCSPPGPSPEVVNLSRGSTVRINLRNSKIKSFMACQKDTVSQHHLDTMPASLARIWDEAQEEEDSAIADMPVIDMDAADDDAANPTSVLPSLYDNHPGKWLLRVTGCDDRFFDTEGDACRHAEAAVSPDDDDVRVLVTHLVRGKSTGAVNIIVNCLDKPSSNRVYIKAALRWKSCEGRKAEDIGVFTMIVDTGCPPDVLVRISYANAHFGKVLHGVSGLTIETTGGKQEAMRLAPIEFKLCGTKPPYTKWRTSTNTQTIDRLPGDADILLGLPLMQRFIFTLNKAACATFEDTDPCKSSAARLP